VLPHAFTLMKDRVLKGRTPELYDGLLRNHLCPTFGGEPLVSITLASVRCWRKERLDTGPAASQARAEIRPIT
jgi:hypothetical protein